MAKIVGVEVGLGVTFQPKERESVSMDLSIRADLGEKDSVEDTVSYLHRNIRHLIDRNISPFLQATRRLKEEHTYLVLLGEPGIDLGQPNNPDNWDTPTIPQTEIKSLNLRWGQTWEVKPWEFLKSDLKLYVELEDGDDVEQVTQSSTDTIKYLVRQNAKPVLEQCGYFKKKGHVPTLTRSGEGGKTQLPKPDEVEAEDIATETGIVLSI
jgi:hypothetical protein